jgi:PAS domain S-box-containing protein
VVAQALDFPSLFYQAPANYLLIAPDSTIVSQSNGHEIVSLRKRSETIGRPFFEVWPPNSEAEADVIRRSHEHVRTTLTPDTMPLIRYDLERADGTFEERYWEATHSPILDANGQLLYILQRTEDVTERVRAEKERQIAEAALVEQRAFTDFVLDTLPLIVWTNDPHGTTTYFNHGWYAFTGTARTATIGDNGHLIHPEDVAMVRSIWQRAAETGTPCQFEYRLRRFDGDYRWMLGRAAPRRDAAGEITLWAGCATDIHNQRVMVQEMEAAAEDQVRLMEQAYQASREAQHQRDMFYGLFQQAPAMICILRGPEHRYEFVNPIYQSVFPNRELVGRSVAEALPEVVEQGIIQLLDRVYQTGESFYGNELLLNFESADGTRHDQYFNFIYKQFHEADGSVAGILVFAFEVTELVLARQRLERLTASNSPN